MSKQAFEKIKSGLDEAIIIAPYVAEIERLRTENEKLREELLHWKYEVTEMTDTILARIMWDAYAVQAGGKTFDGKPLPTWEELGEERQACWLAAASAAAAALKETRDER